MKDDKVVYKLKRQPLSSEREEIKARRIRNIVIAVVMVLFLGLGFFMGLIVNSINNDNYSSNNYSYSKLDEISSYMNNFWLYAGDYDDLDQVLEDNAFYGMTSFSFDPYTSYMSTEEYESFSNSINMNIVGIGITYTQFDGVATIMRVIKNSPAEKAGILAGDIIRKVDGVDVEGLNTTEFSDLALGKEGSEVVVEIERDGQNIEFDIIRASINSTAYAYSENDYVVLKIESFGDETYNECIDYLDDYKDYSKLIIDLRDNTGGFQTSVQEVAHLFLGDDVLVMTQEFNDGYIEEYYTLGSVYYENFKEICVLINGNTASAAEVLAIALKEMHPDVTLVGTTSFGKGVVQSSILLKDSSVLKVTSSKWLSPMGNWINGVGIKPDEEVFLHDIFYDTYTMMEENESYEIDSVSEYNRVAEECLDFLGYQINRKDGYFDQSMKYALSNFQSDKQFEVTGILDSQSYETLISNVIKEWALNPDKDVQMLKAIELISK